MRVVRVVRVVSMVRVRVVGEGGRVRVVRVWLACCSSRACVYSVCCGLGEGVALERAWLGNLLLHLYTNLGVRCYEGVARACCCMQCVAEVWLACSASISSSIY